VALMRYKIVFSAIVVTMLLCVDVSRVNAGDTKVGDGSKVAPNVVVEGKEWTPFQLTFLVPFQLSPSNRDVYGMRANLIIGENKNVCGLDIGGIIQGTDGTGAGIQIAHVISLTSTFYGLQLGLVNMVEKKLAGMQIGFGNETGDMSGLQMAVLGNGFTFEPIRGDIKGVQLSGFANVVAHSVKGVQIAVAYNEAEEVDGLQIGFVNYTDRMTGLQIGIVNIIKEGAVAFCPIINFNF